MTLWGVYCCLFSYYYYFSFLQISLDHKSYHFYNSVQYIKSNLYCHISFWTFDQFMR